MQRTPKPRKRWSSQTPQVFPTAKTGNTRCIEHRVFPVFDRCRGIPARPRSKGLASERKDVKWYQPVRFLQGMALYGEEDEVVLCQATG